MLRVLGPSGGEAAGFRRGEFGPEAFRKKQATQPQKGPDGPKRIIHVKTTFEKYKIPHGKPNVDSDFTRWDVECPDCHRKDAYVMQFNVGGGSMACYGGHCAYSNLKAKDHWNEFEACWIAKRANGRAEAASAESAWPEPQPLGGKLSPVLVFDLKVAARDLP